MPSVRINNSSLNLGQLVELDFYPSKVVYQSPAFTTVLTQTSKADILNMDFTRVKDNERQRVKVPVKDFSETVQLALRIKFHDQPLPERSADTP